MRLALAFALIPTITTVACNEPRRVENVAPRAPSQPSGTSPVGTGQRASDGRLYVPIYSHIYTSGGMATDLAITLSIRNVSPDHELLLSSVRYYDTAGKILDDHVVGEVTVAPLETVEYFVPTKDRRGGSGANFIVSWHAAVPLVPPLIEAVMVREHAGTGSFAFTTRGVEIPHASSLPNERPLPKVDAGGDPGTSR